MARRRQAAPGPRPGSFDFDGAFLKLKGVRANPKPFGGSRPMIMNAGSSSVGQAFALKNCDAFFVATVGSRTSLAGNVEKVAEIKGQARTSGARSTCSRSGR